MNISMKFTSVYITSVLPFSEDTSKMTRLVPGLSISVFENDNKMSLLNTGAGQLEVGGWNVRSVIGVQNRH